VTAMPDDTAAALEAIAREVQRLTPSWQRPEAFHERKSDIVAALRALARGPVLVRQVVRFVPLPAPAAPRVVALQRHLACPARRHRYPSPPARCAGQATLSLITTEPEATR
jgi:hypothetical protein